MFFCFSYYSDRGQCAKCYLSCKTCSGPRRDQCVTCPKGWQLAAGECHPECPEGFFKSNFGCQKCHHYCRTCKGKLLFFISRAMSVNRFRKANRHKVNDFYSISLLPAANGMKIKCVKEIMFCENTLTKKEHYYIKTTFYFHCK